MKSILRNTALSSIYAFLKYVKIDYLRYLVMRPLFKLNGQELREFASFADNQFFLYKVGDTFLPSTSLDWFSSYSGFEEWCDKTSLNKYTVKPGDVVLDIGAGIGEEIVVLSKRVGQSGQVHAIEANTSVFNALNKVKNYNNLQNTKVYNLAVSYTNADVELVADGLSLWGSIGKPSDAADAKTYLVKGSRLDTFLDENHIERVDLLKCNIEGAERFVVDTISPAHLHRIKNVAISCHDFRYRVEGNEFFKTKEYVSDFLIRNGFEITTQHSGAEYIDDYVYGVNMNSGT